MFSRGIAYYRPSGAGKIAVDDRQMPRTMEYGFGTGSVLAVSTERKSRRTGITFTLRLQDTARFASVSGHLLFSCGDTTTAVPTPMRREQRINDGVTHVVDHAWDDVLDTGASSGEFRASLTLGGCKDLPFSFTLPPVRVGENEHAFGLVSMTPQMMPVTWTLPVPSRVEGGLGDR
jgi:hypothetical protein